MKTKSDAQALEEANAVKELGLDSELFNLFIEDVKQSILAETITSPESAVNAHYELKALERLTGRIRLVQANYEGYRYRSEESQSY